MIKLTPEQILSQVEKKGTWTPEILESVKNYISENIERINVIIDEALNKNQDSLELDIPGID